MGIYTEAIQKLYVAYFNRPADAAGLAYWENVVANAKGSTTAISAAFATSAEYKAAYAGMDEYHVVAQVYQNLFGRAPELSGLNFWGQALINKQMTVDNVVTMIAAGAQGADKDAYTSKVSAATAFTAALDTSDKVLAYSGDKANGVAKSFLATVVDATTLANAISTGTLGQVISDVMAAAPQQVGSTYTLTAGMDTLVGTAGNDVFNVYTINPTTGVATVNLSAFDTIDGSAGKDTLNIQIAGTTNTLVGLTAVSKNVETINISADAPNAVDASLFQGATLINQIGNAGKVTNLANGATAGYQGATITGSLLVEAAGAAAGVSFNGVSDAATVGVSGSTLNSVTVSGSRVHVGGGTVGALTLGVTTGKDVQSLSLNTNQKTTLTVTEGTGSTKHVTTVDASASTGAVTFDASANANMATVKTGSGNDTVKVSTLTKAADAAAGTAAINATVSTGAGNDKITVTTTGTGLTTVDAGAGNDQITITKVTGNVLNIQGGDGDDTITLVSTGNALETTDVIDGGAGSNTIAIAGSTSPTADDYIVFNKLLKNFSTLKFSSAETGLDASKLAANYNTIDLFTGSSLTGVSTQAVVANGDVTATANGYVKGTSTTTYAGTLNITEKVSGAVSASADVLSLAVKAAEGGSAVAASVVGDVQSAIVTLTNSVDDSSAPGADVLTSVSITNSATVLKGLKSVTLTGNGSASITNVDTTKLVTVDASGLGGKNFDGTVATAGLTYVSTNSAAETIKLGSGIDKITLSASTYGAIDTVAGLHLVLNTAGAAIDTAKSDTLTVTNIVAANLKAFTTAQTDLDFALKDAIAANSVTTGTPKGADVVFTLGGDTYVFHDGGTIGSLDSADTLVKLAGVTDVKAVIIALGGTPA